MWLLETNGPPKNREGDGDEGNKEDHDDDKRWRIKLLVHNNVLQTCFAADGTQVIK